MTTAARTHWKLALLITASTAAAILTLAGCGSSDSSGTDASPSDTERAAVDLAQCMRDNGVPSFPDPVAKPDGSFGFERPDGVEPSALDDALESCQSEARAAGFDPGSLAQDPEAQDTLLEFSRCMRANGVPDFPDPNPNGNGSLRSVFGAVDLESPQVQQAVESCDAILSQLGAPFSGGRG
jgi:hypothetical protein